jgi:hypothetical protein
MTSNPKHPPGPADDDLQHARARRCQHRLHGSSGCIKVKNPDPLAAMRLIEGMRLAVCGMIVHHGEDIQNGGWSNEAACVHRRDALVEHLVMPRRCP